MSNVEQENKPKTVPNKKKSKSNHKNIWLVLKVIVLMGFMGLFAVGGIAFGFVTSIVKDQKVLSYEEISSIIGTNYLTGFAYFADGTPIGKLPAEEDRRLVTLKDISPHVVDALISTEDKDFENHNGVSFKATSRAIWQQIIGSDKQTGGSTLTQQLVKQTLLKDEFWGKEVSGKYKGAALKNLKYSRKFNEIFLALRVERFYTKPQILEAYLNEMYFGKGRKGSNLYGIQSAAKGIFGVDAKDLNIPQAAYLVGMLQMPGKYTPFTESGLKNGMDRMKLVLGELKKDGKITDEDYNEALQYDIPTHLVQSEDIESAYDQYPFLLFEILDRSSKALVEQDLLNQGFSLEEIHDEANKEFYTDLVGQKERDILTKGYNIYTTIDKKLYDAFQTYASNPDNFRKNQTYTIKVNGEDKKIENALQQVGAILIDNRTGAILASIGGRDFNIEQTNHVAATRQPGSTMKPILAYGPALELGKLLSPESPVDDSPIVLNFGKPNEHTPKNYNDKFSGIISARDALKESWNIPAIRTYLAVGIPTALDYAKKMGISTLTKEDENAQTGVIGGLTNGASVEEMTNAFTTFPNGGNFIDAYIIERIEDKDGGILYKHQTTSTPVFSEQTAYMITDMLRSVYTDGTGKSVKALIEKAHGKYDIAGKSGTTNKDNDLWFIGFTPNISLGVWAGFDQPYTMAKDTSRAKKIWAGLMNTILDQEPELSPKDLTFAQPDGLVSVEIDSKSGMLPSELSKEAGHIITGMFKRELVPTETDTLHEKGRAVIIDGKTYLAQSTTPDDMVLSKIYIKTPPLELPSKPDEEKPPSYYLPADWLDRMPTDQDPRVEDGHAPATPTGLKAAYDGKQVTLTWNTNTESDIAGYRIYRSNGFNFDKVGSVLNHEQKQFIDTGAQKDSGYYISAVDIAGNESPSTPVVSPVGGKQWSNEKPSTPTGMKATKSATGVNISWNLNPKNEQVIQYNIYYSQSEEGPFEFIASSTMDGYNHLNFDAEVGWYKISAVNHRGESEQTAAFTATIEGHETQSPTDPTDGNQTDNGQTDGSDLIDIPVVPDLPGTGH